MARRDLAMPGGPRSGFTLVELAVVVAIIGILAAIASPRYGQAVARYRVETAARRIVEDLRLAQERARTLGASQTVVFDPAADTYEITGMSSLDASSDDYVVDVSAKLYRVDLASADFGGDGTVTFNGYGVPDSGGSVVVRIGNSVRTVTVDSEIGKARVQ